MGHVPLKHGMFGWVDLSTPDPEAARPFYRRLFGWDTEDLPAGDHGVYTMFRKHGRDAAGMGAQPPEQREQGVPPTWNAYVVVDDVDAVTARARELHAQPLLEPLDVPDAGRMAVIRDPAGAVFSLWEARGHDGAGVFNEHGALVWAELATRNVEGSRAFYGDLLGWTYEVEQSGGQPYHMALVNGRPNAGIVEMGEGWPEGLPPHWMVYFQVEDVDAAVEDVREAGGRVHVDPMDIPVGRFAVVADPQGAVFTVFTPNAQGLPPEERVAQGTSEGRE